VNSAYGEAVAVTIVPPPGATKNKGGRPKRSDWPDFNQEMSLTISLDGGQITRQEFFRHMKEWAADHMDPVPADTTIDRHIKQNVHPSAGQSGE